MIDSLPFSIHILIDDGEGRRVDDILHAQFLTKGFDESGFSHTHLSIKSHDLVVAHQFQKLARHVTYFVDMIDFQFHFHPLFFLTQIILI